LSGDTIIQLSTDLFNGQWPDRLPWLHNSSCLIAAQLRGLSVMALKAQTFWRVWNKGLDLLLCISEQISCVSKYVTYAL